MGTPTSGMVQCEMCGVETSAPKTAKIEGAELQVCADCVEFGTEISTNEDEPATTKYSTSSSSSESSSSTGTTRRPGDRSQSRRDMFDEMEEIVPDYHDRIRDAREADGLTQAELADQLNEKTSLIRKLERGDHLPSDTIRRKLERALGIDLLEGSDEAVESEWSSSGSGSGVTLGDIVERKD